LTMSVAETVRLAKLRLEPTAGEESLQQAKLLVAAIIGVEADALMVHTWMDVTEEQIVLLGELLERRIKGEPLQYILGEWEFMGLPFYVDERALIPRQDTELLCEKALEIIRNRHCKSVLDLCTGSGCLAVSIAKLAETVIAVSASDVSADALALAKENASLNGVDASINWIESDLFEKVPGTFDLIVCNPPYLTSEDMDHLQQEVAFEPRLALFGGADGLDFYRRIAERYKAHLNPGKTLLLEIGSTQAISVSALFENKVSVFNDLCGNPRVILAEKSE
jgi:release factor glutamine methyltransferase